MILGLVAASVVLLGGVVLRLRTAHEPLIPISVLANGIVFNGVLSVCFAMSVLIGLIVCLPIYFEIVLGFSTDHAGVALVPLVLGTTLGAMVTSRMMAHQEHYKTPPMIGLAIAIVATLLVGVLAGVVVGVVLSLLWLIAVTTHPQLPELGRQRGTTAYRDVEAHPEDELDPTVAVLRIDGGLFFASCEAVEDRTRDLIHERQNLRGLVLDCAGVNFIDSQGKAQMAAIGRLARQAGLDLQLARVKPAVVDALGRDGFLDLLGRDHLHGNVDQAVRMVRRSDRNGTD